MSNDQNTRLLEWVQLFLKTIRQRTVAVHVSEDEGYKFHAVEMFQKNFSLEAEDLHGMLDISIASNNMSIGAMYFPKKMLLTYAQAYQEETRDILRNLFDETRSVCKRINETQISIEKLEKRRAADYNLEKPASTFIGLRFISLLLGYRYPDIYNALKPSEWKVFARYINPSFKMPNGTSPGEQYRIYSEYIEPLRNLIKNNSEIIKIRDALTEGLTFKDEGLRWITQDIIYVTARVYADRKSQENGEQDKSLSQPSTVLEEDASEHTGFMALEQHLEEFIVRNWDAIDFGEPLRLYVEDDGTTGQQYATDVGVIDILAVDADGDFVVIELKRAESNRNVVGQVLSYIGWVKNNLATKKQKVRGIVIVGKADKTLLSALDAVDNILLKEYSMSMSLKDPRKL